MRPARCSDEVAPAGREAIILAEWAGRWHGWMGLLGVRADSLGVRGWHNASCPDCARQAVRTARLDWFGRVALSTEPSPRSHRHRHRS